MVKMISRGGYRYPVRAWRVIFERQVNGRREISEFTAHVSHASVARHHATLRKGFMRVITVTELEEAAK